MISITTASDVDVHDLTQACNQLDARLAECDSISFFLRTNTMGISAARIEHCRRLARLLRICTGLVEGHLLTAHPGEPAFHRSQALLERYTDDYGFHDQRTARASPSTDAAQCMELA